jgi:hypothetical protein
MRLVIVRMKRFDQRKRAVGKCQGKHIHELFLTSLPVEQFTAKDVLNLYNGRGGFERVLAEEDTEQDGDRWCSWQALGQSFWQILNQWVWNWRLRAGAAQAPELCARQTQWSPALPEIKSEVAVASVEQAPSALPVHPQSDRSAPRYGAMTVAEGLGEKSS